MTRNPLPIRQLQEDVRRALCDLESLCDQRHVASSLLARGRLAEHDSEREHRRMGARFTSGRAGYRASAALAADYFMIQWVAQGPHRSASWLHATEVRLGALYGYALRELLQGDVELAPRFAEWREQHTTAILAIDYARDFAVAPACAASTARVSGSVRYSIGVRGLAGARRAFAAWLSAIRVMSSREL